MGYSMSVSVSARSHRLKSEMYEFLQRLYRPWSEIVSVFSEDDEDDIQDLFEGPFIDGDLVSAQGKCLIGFDYHPTHGPEREYHYALTRWMAIQIGKRRRRFRSDDLTLKRPVPYYVYDGFEAMPILLSEDWPKPSKELEPYVFNMLGMPMSDHIVRELAWFFIPMEGFSTVSLKHFQKSGDEVREALLSEGLEGAQFFLQVIQAEIGRLDVLWRDHMKKRAESPPPSNPLP